MKNFYCAMMIVTAIVRMGLVAEQQKAHLDRSERRGAVLSIALDSAIWPVYFAVIISSEVES